MSSLTQMISIFPQSPVPVTSDLQRLPTTLILFYYSLLPDKGPSAKTRDKPTAYF